MGHKVELAVVKPGGNLFPRQRRFVLRSASHRGKTHTAFTEADQKTAQASFRSIPPLPSLLKDDHGFVFLDRVQVYLLSVRAAELAKVILISNALRPP